MLSVNIIINIFLIIMVIIRTFQIYNFKKEMTDEIKRKITFELNTIEKSKFLDNTIKLHLIKELDIDKAFKYVENMGHFKYFIMRINSKEQVKKCFDFTNQRIEDRITKEILNGKQYKL